MDTQPITMNPPPDVRAEEFEDPDGMRDFVEHYLASRGYRVTSRNARLVVATLATCRPQDLDWPALEQHVDAALDREMMRPAA